MVAGLGATSMYEYKTIYTLSNAKGLRQIEEAEKDGWELLSAEANLVVFFGFGAKQGIWAILRKPKKDERE